MRSNDNNRRLFAAMSVAAQVAQRDPLRQGESTWRIKQRVPGT